MAQMPRGKPRSVPDPDGEQYDEMLRQERLKPQRAGGGFEPEPLAVTEELFPFSPHPDFSRRGQSPVVTVDGIELDTGCVVGGKAPLSQLELAERRRTIDLAVYLANNPLAASSYALATLFRASPKARDRVMLAGGLADAVMAGAAPRGASLRGRVAPPRVQPAPNSLLRDEIRSREVNSFGQARGVDATLTAPMLGTGSKADRRLKPPGWQGNGRTFNEARGHLLARNLGGTGREPWDLVTLTHRGANTPQMSNFERSVTDRVRKGEVIEYGARPMYRDGILPPSSILLTATGSRGVPSARIINNPAGRHHEP